LLEDAMTADYTLLLLSISMAVLLMATVLTYDRLVRGLRQELEDARADSDLLDALLDQALLRHPAKGDQ
jgi:hypothetical protein